MFAYHRRLSRVSFGEVHAGQPFRAPMRATRKGSRNATRFSTRFSTRLSTCRATRFATRFAAFSTIFHNVCEGVVRMRQGYSGQWDTSPATGESHRSNGEIVEKCGNLPPTPAIASQHATANPARGKPEQRRGTRSSRSGHRYNAHDLNARGVLLPINPPRRFFPITLNQYSHSSNPESRMSVTNICPGACVIASGGLASVRAACGVTPHAQKTGTSPVRISTGSP